MVNSGYVWDVEPFIAFGKTIEVIEPEDRDRLGVMEDQRGGDAPSEVEPGEEDQGSVGEPFRLCRVRGREQITDLPVTLVHRGREGDAVDLPDLLGARKHELEDRRCQVLGNGLSPGRRLLTHRPRWAARGTCGEQDQRDQHDRLDPVSGHVRFKLARQRRATAGWAPGSRTSTTNAGDQTTAA
jgi:hypothetical protein